MISKTQEITFRQKWDWIKRFFLGMPSLPDHHHPKKMDAATGKTLLSLVSVGDIMYLGRDYDCREFIPAWQKRYQGFFKIGNLETPIVPNQDKSPLTSIIKFNASPNFARDFLALGFNLVSLANNHALDAGIEGLKATQDFLKQNQIYWVGTTDSPYQIIEIEGVRVGLIAFTYGVNLKPGAEKIITYAWHMDQDFSPMEKLIQQTKEKCDVVVMLCHWGHEFEDWPVKKQYQVAKKMQAAGVDIILGHHPHVPQGYEVLEGEQKTLCLYSQGNFLSNSLIKKHRLGQVNLISLIGNQRSNFNFKVTQDAVYTSFLKSKVKLL